MANAVGPSAPDGDDPTVVTVGRSAGLGARRDELLFLSLWRVAFFVRGERLVLEVCGLVKMDGRGLVVDERALGVGGLVVEVTTRSFGVRTVVLVDVTKPVVVAEAGIVVVADAGMVVVAERGIVVLAGEVTVVPVVGDPGVVVVVAP